jgi:hypothetical protein
MKLKEGDKVTYCSSFKKNEHGIVKSIREDGTIFVVYNCANDWANYKDYTGINSPVKNLKKGWI